MTEAPYHRPDNARTAGADLGAARRALLLVHGRGGSALDMLTLAPHLHLLDTALLAPEATGHTWYPYSFLAPLAQNEPGLSSGLAVLHHWVTRLQTEYGLASTDIFLLGFSQGACLLLEYAARHAQRFGGIFGLSGGVQGPPGLVRDYYAGDFAGTPVLLACSDTDPHIPKERVLETAAIYQAQGAQVTTQLYPNAPHTILPDELRLVNQMLTAAIGPQTSGAASGLR